MLGSWQLSCIAYNWNVPEADHERTYAGHLKSELLAPFYCDLFVNAQVADVIRLVHTSGKQQAAARLAAALVDCGQVAALTDAMIYLASQVCAEGLQAWDLRILMLAQHAGLLTGDAEALQGDAATVATLELGLVNLGRLTALGQVNNCLMASMHLEEAVKIAGERRLFCVQSWCIRPEASSLTVSFSVYDMISPLQCSGVG